VEKKGAVGSTRFSAYTSMPP